MKYFNLQDGSYDLPVVNKLNPNEKSPPPAKVFFSGMLGGQRALDLGSLERLKWHIKAVHDGKTMKK